MRLDYVVFIILLGVGFLLYSLFRRDEFMLCLVKSKF